MALEDEIRRYIITVAKNYGHDELGANIYAILYLSEGEKTLDEIAELTKYSLASVSIKINQLEKMGLVNKRRKPGSKRIYCSMHKSRSEQIRNKINSIYEIEIKYAKDNIPAIIGKYRDMELSESEKKRYMMVLDYMRQIDEMEKIFEKIRVLMK